MWRERVKKSESIASIPVLTSVPEYVYIDGTILVSHVSARVHGDSSLQSRCRQWRDRSPALVIIRLVLTVRDHPSKSSTRCVPFLISLRVEQQQHQQ